MEWRKTGSLRDNYDPCRIPPPSRILGLDFSGAVNAGRKIWLTGGQVAGDALHVTQCRNRGICP